MALVSEPPSPVSQNKRLVSETKKSSRPCILLLQNSTRAFKEGGHSGTLSRCNLLTSRCQGSTLSWHYSRSLLAFSIIQPEKCTKVFRGNKRPTLLTG